MNQDDPPTGFPSDTASLPSPPFLVWVIVASVIACMVYAGYYVIWGTIFGTPGDPGILQLIRQAASSPSSAGSLYDDISVVITPHPLSILVLAALVFGYSYYSPYVWATLQWTWMTITGKRLPDRITSEGFLVSPPRNPGVTESVITRRELLDKLRQRLFAINPPHGIRCGTSPKRDVPYWEPSLKMIHLYLQRVANMYPVTTDTGKATVTPSDEKVAVKEIRLLCEERSIIKEILEKMEIDPTIQYSYREAREHLQPLITFYDRKHDGNRQHPRRVVDDILGLSLGQRDPYNEAEDNIVNGLRHTLPTQTNDVQKLDEMATQPHLANRELRGGNDATPIAPHLLLDS